MKIYSEEELKKSLKLVSSTIIKCENIQPKFKEGTSQHTLLNNRIKALKISKSLMENDDIINEYTIENLNKALPPVISIISKTEKARSKYEEGTNQYNRFSPIIEAMYVAKAFITSEIKKRD